MSSPPDPDSSNVCTAEVLSSLLPEPPPSPGLLLRIWFSIGIQSFGGGTATLALIQRAVVEERRWITETEFARCFALCQITPGINLLALAILIGRRLGGVQGALMAVAGMLLPSVSITILMTAGYAHIRQSPMVHAALKGVLPATIGLGMVTSFQMARPLVAAGRKEGKIPLGMSLAVLAGSGLAVAIGHLPVILILFAAGMLYALFHWLRQRAAPREAAS